MEITNVTTTAVRTPMREPLKWPGGVRQSASGLIVEIHTDEGISGIGEAPGPTLPTIQTIIERELSQFLVGQDPLRGEWLVHRLEEFSRNWAAIAAYAISGLEIALLDIKGKALGAPVAELLGGYCRDRVPVVGYLFIDEPEANAKKAKAFVDAGYTELKLKVGRDFQQDHDSIAAIRDAVGPDVKLRIDANMIWSVPAAIKWIRGLEQFDLQYVEQPVPDFDVQGLAQVRRSVSVPIAADEACTDVRSALELVKHDACDVFVVYPSEAGGLVHARQIAGIAEAAGKWCAVGSWAELGPATIANAHLAAATSSFVFASDTHYPLQVEDVLSQPLDLSDGLLAVPRAPGLGVELDREAIERLANLQVREAVFYDDVDAEAPRVGQIL
ncbi:MAG TPA: mandelate racemase/muconate lactonizing enzyme family protein [Gaiella sp.]|uniref:mandelate racemase/muconate lactonizing enzyme family protein n=1 Tax=Gaiella sp. TaxID=2663207 RepID=UPI002D80E555|nr:mandelate racemase/muconate lactonizing enzyme family protein [Gaiella sp.]HET9289293.1 mandelate racemase/muconate lactonizing enzyme family protein [Gaiella sp.]